MESHGNETKKMLNSCCGGADEVSTRSSGSLDHDSVCKILSSLPVKTLMRAKCVCKSWRYLIESDPHFIYLHFTQSKARPSLLISSHIDSVYGTSFSSADLFEVIDHGAVVYKVTATWAENMLKPVNGLICFIRRIELAVLIYNLSTREETPWIETTTTVKKEEMSGYMYPRYGFGFDPATKEHKVLSVFMKKLEYKPKTTTTTTVRTTTDHDFCEVLTVGQNTWRRINEVPSPYRVCQDAFYGNGALYWLCGHLDKGSCPLSDSVLVFDVGSEKFIRVILIPNFILDSRSPHWSWVLFEVDGRPALIGTTTRIDRTIKMWMFDHDHDNWIVETISSLPSDEQPKWLFSFEAIEGTDLIIIQSNRKTADPVLSLYYYDRKKKTLTAPRGGITIKNAPPCGHGGGGELFSISQPLGIPFNYNITYEISSFVESLFPVNQNQQQRVPSSSGV